MGKQSPLFFRLPESSNLSLRNQVCELISSAITMKSLSLERPLPSCRLLAEQLGVSRNTVFAAYSQLIDLELLVSRDRSGYYVNPEVYKKAEIPASGTSDAGQTPAPVRFAPSGMIPIDNPIDWTRYPYPFIYNQIDPNLFPVDGWRECSRLVLGRKHIPLLMGDSVESDSPNLIEQLRQRLLATRGIFADPDQILITLGAQNALSVLGMVFAQFDQPIAMENPGFLGGFNAFKMAGNALVGVPVDLDGLIPSAIPDGVKIVFTTPSHQFPTMVTMSQARREELLKTAKAKDFLIIEDDYEAEMNYLAKSSPSLRAMDSEQRVMYVGSFSKTVSPGIRVGFIVAHRDIIREARIVRGTMFRHPPNLLQEMIAIFIRLGYYDAHLRNIERRYKKRWQAMRNAIATHLPMLEYTRNMGGTSFWLTGPDHFNGTLLRERLRGRGVLIDKGQDFFLERDRKNCFRLGFAFVPMSKLEAGIKIIAEEVERLL
ncbi:MAG: PLP-dependent aminotransferase family protein [Pseudomonadota bacterium]